MLYYFGCIIITSLGYDAEMTITELEQVDDVLGFNNYGFVIAFV